MERACRSNDITTVHKGAFLVVAYQINHFHAIINMSSNVTRDDICHFYAFSSLAKVHVTVKHGTPNQMQDAMNVWIEHVSQISLKFVCKNGGNLTDLVAIYLWLVKIMSLFAGVRHYTQHSDVEAVS